MKSNENAKAVKSPYVHGVLKPIKREQNLQSK